MAKVEFTRDAIEDIVYLDGSVQPRILKKIAMLEENPEAGQPLGTRGGTRLPTFRKLIVGNRDWRIVYRIELSGEVVVIWVVADREDDAVYLEAAKRLEENPSPESVGIEDFVDRLRRRVRDVIS